MAFRLGGGRSIHLSYEGVDAHLPTRSSMADVSERDERPLLDDRTGDEYGEGWGERERDEEQERLRQLREDKPPHHGD